MPAYTGESNGSGAAGTTSHGFNSSCSTVPTETQRPARSGDPPRAGELPLRKRQGAGSPGSVLAKVELWTPPSSAGTHRP